MLILPYKTLWKPRFQMDKRPLVKGRIANFGIFRDVFEFLRFWMIFSVFQKNPVLWYSWSTLLWHQCYYRLRDSVSPVCGFFHSMNLYVALSVACCCKVFAIYIPNINLITMNNMSLRYIFHVAFRVTFFTLFLDLQIFF